MDKHLYVVGIGPGGEKQMTGAARDAIAASTCVVGYRTYLDLIRPVWPDKTYRSSPMKTEETRAREALLMADSGEVTALISSGDAGVYGMAGLVFELSEAYPEVKIEVVPGVTAATSGAALLGAPLIHDFAVISLSDLMTPWEEIERRLVLAAQGDFVIVLYNPASHRRADYVKRACGILLRELPPDRVCGIARRIGREGETYELCSLGELGARPADMFSTVFIGKSTTRRIGDKMVTPRGYQVERHHGS